MCILQSIGDVKHFYTFIYFLFCMFRIVFNDPSVRSVGSKYISSTGNTMFLFFPSDGSVLLTGFQVFCTFNTRGITNCFLTSIKTNNICIKVNFSNTLLVISGGYEAQILRYCNYISAFVLHMPQFIHFLPDS